MNSHSTATPTDPPIQYVPGRTIVIAIYLFSAAQIGRMVAWFANEPEYQTMFPWFCAMDAIYLVLFTWMLWRPAKSATIRNVYLLFLSILVVIMVVKAPGMDFTPGLLVPLSYQVSLQMRGRPRQVWIAAFILLNIFPLILIQSPLRNLALGLPNMAGILVISAYITAAQESELIGYQSRKMLADLQDANQKLQAYTRQIEELASIEERNRLARELHDSVSQTIFSIMLNIRAAQLLFDKNPERVPDQLQTLQALSQSALAEMRGLIAQMRPKAE